MRSAWGESMARSSSSAWRITVDAYSRSNGWSSSGWAQ